MNYGVPYQGSKSRIAKDIIEQLPTGKRFVDLFAGGCAMTHAAILSQKYEKFLCNDKFPFHGQDVFRQACAGEFNKPEYQRFIGHDEFFERRYKEGWVIDVWGWGYLTRYLGKKRERMALEQGADDVTKLYDKGISPDPKTRMNRLQSLSGVDISNVEFTQLDYSEYQWKEGDVVYCDPPYNGTGNYGKKTFDANIFWDWVRTRNFPVYVSEYNAPDDFKSIWNKRRGTMTSPDDPRHGTKGIASRVENLYIHSKYEEGV